MQHTKSAPDTINQRIAYFNRKIASKLEKMAAHVAAVNPEKNGPQWIEVLKGIIGNIEDYEEPFDKPWEYDSGYTGPIPTQEPLASRVSWPTGEGTWKRFEQVEEECIGVPGIVQVSFMSGSKAENRPPRVEVKMLDTTPESTVKWFTDKFPDVGIQRVKREDCITELKDLAAVKQTGEGA